MQLTTDQLITLFQPLTNWQDRYRQIILLAKELPPFPHELCTENNQIDGCENRVWLSCQLQSEQTLTFMGDSEGRIVKGLMAILFILANNKTAQHIVDTDFLGFLQQLNVINELSQSRQLGINNIVERMKQLAAHDIS